MSKRLLLSPLSALCPSITRSVCALRMCAPFLSRLLAYCNDVATGVVLRSCERCTPPWRSYHPHLGRACCGCVSWALDSQDARGNMLAVGQSCLLPGMGDNQCILWTKPTSGAYLLRSQEFPCAREECGPLWTGAIVAIARTLSLIDASVLNLLGGGSLE